MKLNVFISVVVLHAVIIAGLYLLSACSTNSTPTADDTRLDSTRGGQTVEHSRAAPTRPTERSSATTTTTLDPAFNTGSAANRGDAIHEPTRPAWEDSQLNEFPEEEVLQSNTSYRSSQTTMIDYTVKKGDSLWKISKNNGCSLNDLLAANGLTKNSVIHPGMSLVIPSESSMASIPTTSAGGSSEYYVVVRGDTLSGIAKQFNTSIADIKAANGLRNNVIQLGKKLTIPVNSNSNRAPSSSSTTTSRPSPSNTLSDGGFVIHVVKSGDFPSKIARMYGITTQQLMSDNGISDPRKLRAGQKLKIRLTGAAQGSAPVEVEVEKPLPTPTVFQEEEPDLDELDFDDIPEVEAIPGS